MHQKFICPVRQKIEIFPVARRLVRAVNAAKRANSSIEINLIADEFVTSVKKEYESYKSGSDEAGIRELPVATIDAHMNEFAHKINENYSCEVSVSASKTYSLKLIETSGEKKTQIMIVSVDVKEVKDKNDAKAIGYTYSVVKWSTTSQTVEEPNVGDVTNEQIMKLAQKFLQLYISENKDSNTIMFAMSRYIQNLSDLDGKKFSKYQYSIVTERNAYGDEICYSVVYEKKDGTYDVIFKYNIVLSAEKKEPSFVIYDNETLKPKYGFVVYGESDIYCVIHPYDEDGNAGGNSGTTVVVTTSATTTTTAIVASEVNQ